LKNYFVNYSANEAPATNPAKFYDIGAFQLACSGAQAGAMGELWIEYGFTMIRRLQNNVAVASGVSHWSSANQTISAPIPQNLTLQGGGSLACASRITFGSGSSGSEITFPSGFPGNYMLSFILNTSVAMTAAPAVGYGSGINGLNVGSSPTSTDVINVDYSFGAQNVAVTAWITVPMAGGLVGYNTSGAAALSASGFWALDLWVTQLPPTLLSSVKPSLMDAEAKLCAELAQLRAEFAEFKSVLKVRDGARRILDEMELEESSDEERKRDDMSSMIVSAAAAKASSKRTGYFGK